MKVYCDNCKYFQIFTFNCMYPSNIMDVDTWIYKKVMPKRTASDINHYNDCKWYKRKWYKFWV